MNYTEETNNERKKEMIEKKEAIIELINLNKSYNLGDERTLEVLRHINLNIYKDEIIIIMGPSGSGKSTLLNIIGLIDNFNSGYYKLGSVNVSNLSNKEKQKVRLNKIGFIFQTFNLISTMNVQENVEIPLALHKIPQKEQKTKALNTLQIVGLEDKVDKYPHQLSIGEQQRVAIARALVHKPPLILADEPTGELDYDNMENIMGLISSIHKKQLNTFVIVTHDNNLKKYGDRVLYLMNGCISEKL